MSHFAKKALLGIVVVALGGCSGNPLRGDRIDYKSAEQGNTLEVPPDLTRLSSDPRYVTSGEPVTANAFEASQRASAGSSMAGQTAPGVIGDVQIERSGDQHWLVVNRPAGQLWDPVRGFWQENGFLLAVDQPDVGIMETDWAENRAKLPMDFIRRTIGRVFDSLYSTGELDRFRTRMERTADDRTEIYITHRGMMEVYSSTQQDNTVWQPRPSDHELEVEFLRRLMVALGVPQERSEVMVASGVVPREQGAKSVEIDGAPALELADGFDRAWRRVGLALDRTGFTVEDRDRSKGLYFVRYVPPDANTKKPGFFGKLFGGGGDATPPARYRVAVRETGDTTVVQVLGATGDQADASKDAGHILGVLADELK